MTEENKKKEENLKKMTLSEIKSKGIKLDFKGRLNNAGPLQRLYLKVVKVWTIKQKGSLLIRLTLLLDRTFFNALDVPLEGKDKFIEDLTKFPRHRVIKINGLKYTLLNVEQRSTRVVETTIGLNDVGDVTLADLPYRICDAWENILDSLSA